MGEPDPKDDRSDRKPIRSFLATFEDGVLKPHEPLNLPSNTQVRVSIELVEAPEAQDRHRVAWEELQRLWRESPIDSGGDRLSRDELHERR